MNIPGINDGFVLCLVLCPTNGIPTVLLPNPVHILSRCSPLHVSDHYYPPPPRGKRGFLVNDRGVRFHWWQLKDGLQDMCQFLRQGARVFPTSAFFALFILPIHGPGFAMIFFTLLILARLGKLHHKMKHGKGPCILYMFHSWDIVHLSNLISILFSCSPVVCICVV
eukprot:sb/3472449/